MPKPSKLTVWEAALKREVEWLDKRAGEYDDAAANARQNQADERRDETAEWFLGKGAGLRVAASRLHMILQNLSSGQIED